MTQLSVAPFYCGQETSDLVVGLVTETFEMMNVDIDEAVYIDVHFMPSADMSGAMGWTADQSSEEDIYDILIEIDEAMLENDFELRKTIVHEAIHATQICRKIPFCEKEAYANEGAL